jgi:hypothetical protein
VVILNEEEVVGCSKAGTCEGSSSRRAGVSEGSGDAVYLFVWRCIGMAKVKGIDVSGWRG